MALTNKAIRERFNTMILMKIRNRLTLSEQQYIEFMLKNIRQSDLRVSYETFQQLVKESFENREFDERIFECALGCLKDPSKVRDLKLKYMMKHGSK